MLESLRQPNKLIIVLLLPIPFITFLLHAAHTYTEETNIFFFDTSNSRPLTVLFLPSASIPDSARSGTVQLSEAASYSPLQVIQGITTLDAAEYDFTLQIEQGMEFEVFGFLDDGQGKALGLTRTVTTPLPSASSCLNNVQTM